MAEQRGPKALACCGRKRGKGGKLSPLKFICASTERVMNKQELPAKPVAPLTHEQMKPHPDPPPPWKRMIEGF
ncbi:MAG TPA: hypothetical protein VJ746_17515 [Nitrospira sp.]|nr:hypothetical protein [Nitrospira sp.]